MIAYTVVNGEVVARRWLCAEDLQNVVDGVGGHASRRHSRRISVSEEMFPRRVQPQLLAHFR